MPDLQSQFLRFHDAIKVDFDGNQPLRDKRDIIISNLKDGLKRSFFANTPTFTSFNQGSYDLATGIQPLQGNDYDIDVGVIFDLNRSNYKPLVLKQYVYNALSNVALRTVEIRRPCVRVQYHKYGTQSFHIDLAIYARDMNPWGGFGDTLYIAKGLPGSVEANKVWEVSEPFQLKELIKNKVSSGADRDQFRRIIRYLKRWKDYNFSAGGAGKPTGIALTACCYNLFVAQKNLVRNPLNTQWVSKHDDLRALKMVVAGIINSFWHNNITVQLPVKPYNNLFEKMTPIQMAAFKIKLESLLKVLNGISSDIFTSVACSRLRTVFGGDFPSS
jgi:hypothetical protein